MKAEFLKKIELLDQELSKLNLHNERITLSEIENCLRMYLFQADKGAEYVKKLEHRLELLQEQNKEYYGAKWEVLNAMDKMKERMKALERVAEAAKKDSAYRGGQYVSQELHEALATLESVKHGS